jgi:hypothetical protein
MKLLRFLLTAIFLFLSACAPAVPIQETTAEPGTVTAIGPIVGTAVPDVSTGVPPGDVTPQPTPTLEPPTPIPALPTGAKPTELKYLLLEQYPDMFYCDPDLFPVARGDEQELALAWFPLIQANQEEFQAILANISLASASSFTDEQKLLIYREHKKLAAISFQLADDEYQFQLQVAESEGQEGMIVNGLIDGNGSITVEASQPTIATCPICLARGTLIDTPNGPVSVETLRRGDIVWTVDKTGGKIPAEILIAARTIAPADHRIVHVLLADGRELWVSAGHPTADLRTVGELEIGDSLDGSRILRLDRMPYGGAATYDVLPSGTTGFYWANGILMGSTLRAGD